MTSPTSLERMTAVAYDWISFTTDYRLDDGFVAACVGVIGGIAPGVGVLHVTHTVPAQDVRRGALVLAQTVPYLPPAVHLAVVDPGVGTSRLPVVLVTAGGLLVGPDNGLLIPAATALGGVLAAYELSEPDYRLSTVSSTFHGRDVFAPAAAHLANGVAPDWLGPAVDPAALVQLDQPKTVVRKGKLVTEVQYVDGFGNLQLAATATDLTAAGVRREHPVRAQLAGRTIPATLGHTFADTDPGAVVLYLDSAGFLALAVNGGSAAAEFGATPGVAVTLTFRAGA